MSLTNELGNIRGDKLTYMLMRISGMDTATTKKMINLKDSTYNGWLRESNSNFVQLHRRIPELIESYREEAFIQLRKENQLSAILLEKDLLTEMREEVRAKDYKLVKTNLARTVYERVMDSMAETPSGSGSFQQRLYQMFNFFQNNPQAVPEGDIIDANPQATSGFLTQPRTSQISQEGETPDSQAEEVTTTQ